MKTDAMDRLAFIAFGAMLWVCVAAVVGLIGYAQAGVVAGLLAAAGATLVVGVLALAMFLSIARR
jgi:hypothetical protein